VRAQSASQAAAPPSQPIDAQKTLTQYCVTCHNQRLHTADLLLDTMDVSNVAQHAERWEQVIRKLRSGSMPPAGSPRPDRNQYRALITSLETALDRAAADHPNPGRTTVQRLNRVEYANAIRDLLDLEIDTR